MSEYLTRFFSELVCDSVVYSSINIVMLTRSIGKSTNHTIPHYTYLILLRAVVSNLSNYKPMKLRLFKVQIRMGRIVLQTGLTD